ncbi:MAG: hypothetical protein HC780_27305 [Leptolyngbyaceae cyanobacterium CSU_1_3]|nr:hypothetical protein [Leptolyngbyaceae cyanobacterium CSU_1_3]
MFTISLKSLSKITRLRFNSLDRVGHVLKPSGYDRAPPQCSKCLLEETLSRVEARHLVGYNFTPLLNSFQAIA